MVAVTAETTTTLTATISSTTALTNQNFTIKGRLTQGSGAGLNYQTITLERSTDNKTFTPIATTGPNQGSSYYNFSRNETTVGTYYYRTTYAGTITYANATSNVVKVTVTTTKTPTTLTASINMTTASTNQNFTIKGRLTQSGVGLNYQAITLERSTDNKTFTPIATTGPNQGSSYYNFSRNETTAGTYYYRTTYAGTATYTNATSNVVKVTVS
jgi:hypothetical protein